MGGCTNRTKHNEATPSNQNDWAFVKEHDFSYLDQLLFTQITNAQQQDQVKGLIKTLQNDIERMQSADTVISNSPQPILTIEVKKGKGLVLSAPCCRAPRPFVLIKFPPNKTPFTTALSDYSHPNWFALFEYKHDVLKTSKIIFKVKFRVRVGGPVPFGSFELDVQELKTAVTLEKWFPVKTTRTVKDPAVLVRAQYIENPTSIAAGNAAVRQECLPKAQAALQKYQELLRGSSI